MMHKPKTVTLFMPCLADLYYPSIGRATVKVLKSAGLSVHCPDKQTCCGQWAVNIGRPEAAVPLAKHFIHVFERSEAVAAPSGSCIYMVRKHYPEILKNEPDWRRRAEALAERCFELTDFLVNVLGVTDLDSRCHARVTLHDSCHPLRGLRIKSEPRRLLAMVEGLELVEMADPELCCGFGGAFMGKFPNLSRSMASEKLDMAEAVGADILVMTEPGCRLNLETVLKARSSRLKIRHIAEILAGGDDAA